MKIDKQDHLFAQLIKKAQNGDKKAYETLLTNIAPLIQKFSQSRLGKNIDHEDIVQETLVAIHKSGHTYNTDRSFKNWMFAIASYKVNNYLRSHYRHKAIELKNTESFQMAAPSHVTNEDPSKELLDDLMESLPQKQRNVVRLMKQEGFSVKEAALMLNMSIPSVKVTAHRAYKALVSMGQESSKRK